MHKVAINGREFTLTTGELKRAQARGLQIIFILEGV